MPNLLERAELSALIERRLCSNPILLLLGPRQCGKTTLARAFTARRKAEY